MTHTEHLSTIVLAPLWQEGKSGVLLFNGDSDEEFQLATVRTASIRQNPKNRPMLQVFRFAFLFDKLTDGEKASIEAVLAAVEARIGGTPAAEVTSDAKPEGNHG